MTATAALSDLAPYELAEAVLDVLRAAQRPLSAHAAAEALVASDIPRQLSGRAECIHTGGRHIAPVLEALRAAGRVTATLRGSRLVYEASCPTAEVETRIRHIETMLGGRPVEIVHPGTDPIVTVTAPLSRIEAIGQ
jgi:hypothetical protein